MLYYPISINTHFDLFDLQNDLAPPPLQRHTNNHIFKKKTWEVGLHQGEGGRGGSPDSPPPTSNQQPSIFKKIGRGGGGYKPQELKIIVKFKID